MPNHIERDAINLVVTHLHNQGYTVENVSKGKRADSQHRGYDLVAQRPEQVPLKIEVKGCSRPWGIPDLYETEFDRDNRLVADFLYVVYFGGEERKLCVIPRDAIKPEHVTQKLAFRISSRFKNKKSLEPYLQPL